MALHPGVEFMWQGKHHMVVTQGQDIVQLPGAPLLSRVVLALGTVTVTARMVAVLFESTLITAYPLTAQCFGSTLAEVIADFGLFRRQAVVLPIGWNKA
jgi:hypothetical protein